MHTIVGFLPYLVGSIIGTALGRALAPEFRKLVDRWCVHRRTERDLRYLRSKQASSLGEVSLVVDDWPPASARTPEQQLQRDRAREAASRYLREPEDRS